MIRYSVIRIGDKRVVAALVNKSDLAEPKATQLIGRLEARFPHPVMLVARDDASWTGIKVRANFEAEPAAYAMLAQRDHDWGELESTLEWEAA